jgi:hypothetical protein
MRLLSPFFDGSSNNRGKTPSRNANEKAHKDKAYSRSEAQITDFTKAPSEFLHAARVEVGFATLVPRPGP